MADAVKTQNVAFTGIVPCAAVLLALLEIHLARVAEYRLVSRYFDVMLLNIRSVVDSIRP